jgi:hypothetical protein
MNNNNGIIPQMADGRFITDYGPNCVMNHKLQQGLTSFEFRQFLQNNSEEIVSTINQNNQNMYGCSTCTGNQIPSSKFKMNCNEINCQLNLIDNNGIGLQ